LVRSAFVPFFSAAARFTLQQSGRRPLQGGGEKIEDRVREEMTNGCSFEQQQNNLLSLIADASESS
jgi:hypothetical protein